jgi:hypothetical protein
MCRPDGEDAVRSLRFLKKEIKSDTYMVVEISTSSRRSSSFTHVRSTSDSWYVISVVSRNVPFNIALIPFPGFFGFTDAARLSSAAKGVFKDWRECRLLIP